MSQAGKNRHEHIMESLELFGREVLPEFQDRQDKADKDKAERVAPIVEAAMARKVDNAPPLPDDYTIPALGKAFVKQLAGDQGDEILEKLANDRAVGKRDPRAGIAGGL